MLSVILMSALIIGHRGASGHAPENTLPAFQKAIEQHADGIELDIWPDVEGVPTVIHDEELSRTTRHKGKVTAMRRADLEPLGIPSYQQVLDMAQGKLIIFTELKGQQEQKVGEAIEQAVATGGWSYEQLPVIGFNHQQLARLKERYPDISIGLSFGRRTLEVIPAEQRAPYMVAKASSHHADAINPDYDFATAELVQKAHAAGLKVNVWTVNTPEAMDRMLELGVDAIMTDYPDRLYTKLHGE
jgi:glycerophosphoryl diester phosphodiesterase